MLAHTRELKMARSAHAYVRGSTRQFYAWLRSASSAHVPEGPPVWICGDCHVGNLGPLVDADGKVEVQIRDVDQTVHRQSCPRPDPPRAVFDHGQS